MKVPEHIPNFLQIHKFVLGLKETLYPLVHKEKCTTLNEAVELALVLEDGKTFPQGSSHKPSWSRIPCQAIPSTSALPIAHISKGRENRAIHMIKIYSVFSDEEYYKMAYENHPNCPEEQNYREFAKKLEHSFELLKDVS